MIHEVKMTDDSQSPSPPPARRLLTTAEVAEILRVSTPTVRRLHRRGKLDALPNVRTLRFSTVTVDEFIKGPKK
jgi:excisionase family DNA binding protein